MSPTRESSAISRRAVEEYTRARLATSAFSNTPSGLKRKSRKIFTRESLPKSLPRIFILLFYLGSTLTAILQAGFSAVCFVRQGRCVGDTPHLPRARPPAQGYLSVTCHA